MKQALAKRTSISDTSSIAVLIALAKRLFTMAKISSNQLIRSKEGKRVSDIFNVLSIAMASRCTTIGVKIRY